MKETKNDFKTNIQFNTSIYIYIYMLCYASYIGRARKYSWYLLSIIFILYINLYSTYVSIITSNEEYTVS